MTTTAVNGHATVGVDASGIAIHPDDPTLRVRVAIGAFGDPLSLWSQDSPRLPWLSQELLESAMRSIQADETSHANLRKQLLANAEASYGGFAPPPKLRPVLVPLVHAPVFDNRIKRLGLSGGRNSMKTWSAMTWAVLEVAKNPVNIIFAREFQASMRASSHRAVSDRIRSLELPGFTIQRDLIRHENGGEISFIGLDRNPDSVRSTENVRAVVVEEAHRITRNSITILEPTLRRPGARAIYVWNRVSPTDPVDEMFYGEGYDNPVIHTTWRDNPFVPPSVVGDVIADKRRDIITARHVWDGEPLIRTDARVFPDSCFRVGDLDDQLPDNAVALYGADWGFAQDPTVLVQVYVLRGRTLYIRREAYAVGIDVDEVPALFAGTDPQGRWANLRGYPGIPGALHGRITADSAGPAYIRYLKSRGFTNVRRSKKGPSSVENGIAKIKSYDVVIHPSCAYTIREFQVHRYEVDRKTEAVLPKFVDADNHCVDACRYAIESLR